MFTAGSTNRFGHLLEPIRDLANNWEIDIAKEVPTHLETPRPRPCIPPSL